MKRRPHVETHHQRHLSSEASPSTHFPYPELQQQRGPPRRSMATSLTINPSPVSVSSYRFPDSSPRATPPVLSRPTPRPKLSLNTSTCTPRTLGRGNTGLRLDVLSANSPTSRNTYKNTYEGNRPSLLPQDSLTITTSPHANTPSSPKPPTPHPLSSESTASRRSSETSTTSTDSSTPESPTIPYYVPSHIKPILTNSRLPKRARTTIASATTPKVFFPPIKRVCFRQPLAEEVRTQKYKLRHSDLLELEGAEEQQTAQESCGQERKPALQLSTQSPTLPNQPYHDDDRDDSDDAAYPKTPIAGRRKRIRDWRWTLGPLEGSTGDESGDGECEGEGEDENGGGKI